MIVQLRNTISQKALQEIFTLLGDQNLPYSVADLNGQSLIVIDKSYEDGTTANTLSSLEGVEFIKETSKPYQLVSRDFKDEATRFEVNGETIGQGSLNLVAGPCSIESRSQIMETAHFLSEIGIKFLRGGAYKPRTSPYAFQGLGLEGLKMMREAADVYGMSVITELLDYQLIDEIAPYTDIFQVGSRNMFNYYLLKQLGEQQKPILLKRGMFARLEEWLLAAEYILLHGNEKVILCERGLRTFDPAIRNQLDISAIPLVKELSHLPIWADPSQGSGKRSLVEPLSKAALGAGVDGLMIEVHPDPDRALSDGIQSINLSDYQTLVKNIQPIAENLNKNSYIGSDFKDYDIGNPVND